MFINKWLVADSFEINKNGDWQTGFCLTLRQEPPDITRLYNYLQKQPENFFTILLSEEDAFLEKISEPFIEKIVSLFFQPCYYLFNYQPVLFLTGKPAVFRSRLLEKCRKQGLQILILEVKNDHHDAGINQFAYQVRSADINYDLIVKSWLSQ